MSEALRIAAGLFRSDSTGRALPEATDTTSAALVASGVSGAARRHSKMCRSDARPAVLLRDAPGPCLRGADEQNGHNVAQLTPTSAGFLGPQLHVILEVLSMSLNHLDQASGRPRPARRSLSRYRAVGAFAAAALALSACGAGTDDGGGGAGGDKAAAGYPERDITFVVPFSAGGPTDTVTRLIAEPMSKDLGGSVIVQNVEGAGGTIAAGQVASAKSDGYTVLMHHIGMSTAPALYANLPFKPLEDFKTVGLVTEVPMTIIARKDFEPKTFQELTAYLKKNAKDVTLANAGVGAASQLCGLLLQEALDIKLTEVPYKGTGPALTDLVGGQVDLMCDQSTNTTGQIKGNEVRAYAVTTPERVKSLPDLPTTEEAGLPELKVGVWHGLYVPADTPDAVVEKLTASLQKALKDTNVVTQLAELGAAPSSEEDATPAAHSKLLADQIKLWEPIIKKAGVTAK